ncbi:unnamed protein product [Ixodes hexagonus]
MTIMNVVSDDEDNNKPSNLPPEELLLQAARSGAYTTVKGLLNDSGASNDAVLNLDCKGKQKANLGWTPLHLACYFGHFDVAEILLEHGAYVDVVNREGDTPLHKAAYTGREGLVMLLLKYNADVFIINCEGQSPKQVAESVDIKNILTAAESADEKKKADQFFAAVKEGNVDAVQNLLRARRPPNINCKDGFGNTALHSAAYRDRKEVAVLLLQCGINSTLRNTRGRQLAADLARTDEMRQILHVAPIRQLRKNASRHEGPLLRRKRFLGSRHVWAVLDRGVLSFFRSRGDAATGMRRKRFHYLDTARVECDPTDEAGLIVLFTDDPPERLTVPPDDNDRVDRMRWVGKLKEHIEFSRHYTHQGMSASDSEEEDLLPLGSIQDVLATAQAQQQLLERGVDRATAMHADLVQVLDAHQLSCVGPCQDLLSQWKELLLLSRAVSSSLGGCTLLLKQQEEARSARLEQERERSRVLQESLSVLAREHHQLECTLSNPGVGDQASLHSDDEFFDAFEGGHCFLESLYPRDIPRTDLQTPSLSPSAEKPVLEALHFATTVDRRIHRRERRVPSATWSSSSAKVARLLMCWQVRLPVPMFSKNDFSLWSILKQCIGKELSKITMPVVFNEPLSFLQRISENMEYSHLLVQADQAESPVDRMELVTAFAVSALASNLERLSKPFNPLLGETYELIRYAVVPLLHVGSSVLGLTPFLPASANPNIGGDYASKSDHSNFIGRTDEFVSVSKHISMFRDEVKVGDERASALICEIGAMRTLIRGAACPTCGRNELSAQEPIMSSEYARSSLFLRRCFFHGNSFLQSPEPCELEDGEIPKSDSTYSLDIPNSRLLWRATPRPDYSPEYYHFTLFAMALNEMEEGMPERLPRTDCRLRPDMRRLEAGDLDGAAAEKNRLEEKQREARKHRKKHKDGWEPR